MIRNEAPIASNSWLVEHPGGEYPPGLMGGRFIIFTSLPRVGGHSTLTLGIAQLMRPYFAHIEVWCKVMPEHGHSSDMVEKLAQIGVPVIMVSDETGRLKIGSCLSAIVRARRSKTDVFLALAMRHLSVVFEVAIQANHSVYYHITHDLNASTISRLRVCAKFFSKVAFICPATYEQFPGASDNPTFTWVAQSSELPVKQPDELASERAPFAEGPCRFGLLGRLTKEKGAEVMLEFADAATTECSLRVAGVGPFADAFRDRASREDPHPCTVIFHGAYDPANREQVLRTFFNSIDFLVVPSQDEWETLSMVALESLQHGVPVIMCRAGGLVSFGHSELGPAPSDVIDLVDVPALPAALHNRAVINRLPTEQSVLQCRKYYTDWFSDRVVLTRWLRVLMPSETALELTKTEASPQPPSH